jgi:hypothetical protein
MPFSFQASEVSPQVRLWAAPIWISALKDRPRARRACKSTERISAELRFESAQTIRFVGKNNEKMQFILTIRNRKSLKSIATGIAKTAAAIHRCYVHTRAATHMKGLWLGGFFKKFWLPWRFEIDRVRQHKPGFFGHATGGN